MKANKTVRPYSTSTDGMPGRTVSAGPGALWLLALVALAAGGWALYRFLASRRAPPPAPAPAPRGGVGCARPGTRAGGKDSCLDHEEPPAVVKDCSRVYDGDFQAWAGPAAR